MTAEQDAMTCSEAAAFLKIHQRTLLRLVKDCQIKAARFGGTMRFSRRALTEILDKGINTNHPARPPRLRRVRHAV